MGIVHTSQGGLSPASKNLRSEPWIVSSLASKTLDDSRDWMSLSNDYDKIRDLMANALSGFENYNERVRSQNGFALPNPPRIIENLVLLTKSTFHLSRITQCKY